MIDADTGLDSPLSEFPFPQIAYLEVISALNFGVTFQACPIGHHPE